MPFFETAWAKQIVVPKGETLAWHFLKEMLVVPAGNYMYLEN
jgi:hypothetical protein